MRTIKLIFALIVSVSANNICSTTLAAQTDTPEYLNTSLDFQIRAVNLVEQMTLEEKISQLGNNAPAIPRLGVQQYDWWNECLHGVARAGTATVFPQAIGMAATFDRRMMYDTACVISDEARAKHHQSLRDKDYGRYKGLTFWSPNINIFRDPRWGRGHETYGEDPYLTGQMGIQFVQGLQGSDPKYLKLVATAKHYAVHNGPEPDRHTFNAVPNARDLWETYLPAFHDLIVKGKAYSVMGAYNRVDGESASASWMLLEDILRKQWGFEGYVVSDCGAISDIYAYHKIVNSPQEAATIGIRRGCDLNCGSVYQRALLKAVNEGLINEGEIDLAVYRLMLARMKLGMFDPPREVLYAQIQFEVNDCQKHNQQALEMAQKSMTLLKNDGLLPLDKTKIKRIAVIGPNASSTAALRGNYYGNASNPVTVLKGIEQIAGKDIKVSYSMGCPLVPKRSALDEYQTIDAKYLSTTDDDGKTVPGLTGQYYRGRELQSDPVVTFVDSQIDFDWDTASPTDTAIAQGIITADQKIPSDNFSIRWTGQLLAPATGTYELGLVSDDGSRLYIDGKKIAEGWSDGPMRPFTGEIKLEEGKKYDVTIEYYESAAQAGVRLVWQRPDKKGTLAYQISDETLEDVKNADVAIFVGGLDAELEGEEMGIQIEGFNRGDRTKIELPKIQLDAIETIRQTGTPVVLVLLAGSSVAFDGLDENIPAILMAWYPGQRGGDAIANTLFGDYNPAGRLPVTFYASTQELADFKDYNMHAGKGQTYRYYTGQPLYPFGHGLSYTSFEYSRMKINHKKIDDDDNFNVSVIVKNTGNYDGQEVVQLYIRDMESDLPMPIKQLRGFERIELKKGQQKKVTFKLNAAEDLRYYNPRLKQYTVEPGQFEIQIGASSQDIRQKGIITVR